MKVHVHPISMPKKWNITLQYDITAALSQPAVVADLSCRQKKLRRLPHIFAKFLELPFSSSNTDVFMEETPNFLKFVVSVPTDVVSEDVRAHTVEIYPGICKIVIRGNHAVGDGGGPAGLGELEMDRWRFRLPDSTCLDLASASYRDGELVVLVPKSIGADGLF